MKHTKIGLSFYTFLLLIIIGVTSYFNYDYLIQVLQNTGVSNNLAAKITYLISFYTVNCFVLATPVILSYTFLGLTCARIVLLLLIITQQTIKFYQIKFGIIINQNIIDGMLNTDAGKSQEIISFALIFELILAIALTLLVFYFVKIKKSSFRKKFKQMLLFILLLSIGNGLVFLHYQADREAGKISSHEFVNIFANNNPNSMLFAYHQYNRKSRALRNIDYSLDDAKPYILKNNSSDLKIILVLGEAARRDKLSLNGYHRETNPRLSKVNNLFSFTNTTSCSTATTGSLYCIMNRDLKNNKAHNLAIVLKSLGFHTTLFSLKNYAAVYNSWQVDSITTKYDYLTTSTNLKIYDQVILDSLKEALATDSGKQLYILETGGSHAVYTDRYPKEFEKYTPVCSSGNLSKCNLQHLHNAYDNTIYYTDYILAEVIKLFKDKNAILFYISDHGESLGENGIFTHAMPEDKAPPEQFNIPYLIWGSDSFIKYQPDKFANIKSNLNKKLSQSNIFHSVLDCIGVEENLDLDISVCQITPP